MTVYLIDIDRHPRALDGGRHRGPCPDRQLDVQQRRLHRQCGRLDIWNTSDQFRFVYQALSGDVEVIARVDSLTNVQAYTNAGVMIRGSLAANAIHGYSAVTAAQGVFFRRRVTAGATTTSTLGRQHCRADVGTPGAPGAPRDQLPVTLTAAPGPP